MRIKNLEKTVGDFQLKIDDLIKLCKFYNLSADYMIGLTDEEK